MDWFWNPNQNGVAKRGHDGLGPRHCLQGKGYAVCQGDMEAPKFHHHQIVQEML